MKGLTHFGDATSWTLVALILISVGSVESRETGLLLGWGAGIAAMGAQVVKRLSRRRRPDAGIAGFKALVANPDAFSFPSGHTAAACGVAVAVMGHGAGLGPLMGGLAAAIAISRVYLGAHYPLDVAVGALIGTASGAAAQQIVHHLL
jgi:undecaprenyl-diphosphatase